MQKAPASTIETLVAAMKRLTRPTIPCDRGARHGEKLYETLITREEMCAPRTWASYFRVSPDDRDLNYDLYFTEGVQDARAGRLSLAQHHTARPGRHLRDPAEGRGSPRRPGAACARGRRMQRVVVTGARGFIGRNSWSR